MGEHTMLKRTIALTMACGLLALFMGCSSTGNPFHEETLLDTNWGRSYEAAKYNQIVNPDAGKNPTPVEGLSGDAADYSVEKYEKSFQEKSAQENVTILKLQ
jgi:hypothetical protein